MKLLIAGSMKSTPQALSYTYRVVERAIECNYEIIVGDNPSGIDRVVIQACDKLEVAHYVYHLRKPRFSMFFSVPIKKFAGYDGVDASNRWKKRDRFMVDDADIGMFIWNGYSAGTKAGYDYMQSLNKECWIKTYPMEK